MQEPQLLEDINARLMEEAHEEGPTPAQAALAVKPQQGLTTRLATHVSTTCRTALLRSPAPHSPDRKVCWATSIGGRRLFGLQAK